MIPIIGFISTIIDKIFPDAESAEKAKLELFKMQQQGDLAQLEVNKTEAAHSNMFVAGWRPAIGWVCGAIFAYTFLVQPILVFIFIAAGHPLPPLPHLATGEIMPVLLGLLGLGGLRSYEKVKGVATK